MDDWGGHILLSDVVKLFVSLVLGGIIGAEREYRSKSAGFRTIILVCLGSTTFTILGSKIGGNAEQSRLLANVIMGVGFLGSGIILRNKYDVKGLTTASTIWVSAALGMSVGMGFIWLGVIITAFVLAVLWGFTFFQNIIDKANKNLTYVTVSHYDEKYFSRMEKMVKEFGLTISSHAHEKTEARIKSTWAIDGPINGHDSLKKELLGNPKILEIKF
ncbi:MAG: MgtC/SapB family protein [Cytophagales bacterium]|nr:MgtC/SapB family protein [Cytophagales bacterium]